MQTENYYLCIRVGYIKIDSFLLVSSVDELLEKKGRITGLSIQLEKFVIYTSIAYLVVTRFSFSFQIRSYGL